MPTLADDATDLLQRLVRLRTVNPPGDEGPAIDLLERVLGDAGFTTTRLADETGRPNLVARLRGEAPGPTLGLLGHVDTVLASPEDWSRDPWSGDVVDGELWGRGALDMKGQVAAEVAAAAGLARDGWRPARGELLVMCVADEEAGGIHGAKFLCQEHPDLVRCDVLLNEGGGAVMELAGRRVYSVCVAEKGTFRFAIRTTGTAAHASMPMLGDNALLKLAPLVQRFADRRPAYDLTEVPRAFLAALGHPVEDGDPGPALEALREEDPIMAIIAEPTLGVTFAPTRVRASEKINVIPASAELQVDCRVPPGLSREDALRRVEEVLEGAGEYEIEFLDEVVGNASPMASELMDVLTEWLGDVEPGAQVVPTVLPGFTDSRWFRNAFPDCVAYGFFPQKHQTLLQSAPLIHGADERVDVRDLALAAECYAHVCRRLLG